MEPTIVHGISDKHATSHGVVLNTLHSVWHSFVPSPRLQIDKDRTDSPLQTKTWCDRVILISEDT